MTEIIPWTRHVGAGTIHDNIQTVYLGGRLMDGHPLPEYRAARIKDFDEALARTEFNPDMIYEICFAAHQEEHFGEIARKHDFVRVCLTENPNSGNRIAVYIRQPNIDP